MKTGDRVKFLHEKGEGRVTGFRGKDTILVEIEDGFEIPFLASELILIEPVISSKKEMIIDEIKPSLTEFGDHSATEEDQETWDEEVAFAVNLKKGTSQLNAFLINNSTYNLLYTVSQYLEGEDVLLSAGSLEPGVKVHCGKLLPENLETEMFIHISILFYGKSGFKYLKPFARSLKILPAELYNHKLLDENEYFEEPAMVMSIYRFKEESKKEFQNKSLEPADLKKHFEEQNPSLPTGSKPDENKQVTEVDLHIEAIIENTAGLDNSEIIKIQMDRFRMALDTALLHKTRRIVFIHGVGNGKLKYELRKELDRKYPDLKYQDASYREYGYGATMVFIPSK